MASKSLDHSLLKLIHGEADPDSKEKLYDSSLERCANKH